MSSLSQQKRISAATVATSGTYTDVFEVTNMKTVSLQINKSGTGTSTAAKLQWSNDGTAWKDVNTTTYPDATVAVLTGTNSIFVSWTGVVGSLVRVSMTEAGTNSIVIASGLWIAKQH